MVHSVAERKSAGFQNENIPAVIIVGDLEIDTDLHTVTRGGKEITLSSKEYKLLEYMALRKGEVLTRSEIEKHIWKFDGEGTNIIDVYISYIRRKIDKGREKKLIHTVRGRGYMLESE